MDERARRVGQILRRDFIVLGDGESLHEVDRLMRLARVRHLPMVREGRLRGVVSHRDVLRRLIEALEAEVPEPSLAAIRARPLDGVVRGEVIAVEPDCPLERAAELLLRYGIGFLPVVEREPDGDRLVGIVTESDLLRAAYAVPSSSDDPS